MTALPRRESIWDGEPVMRDGRAVRDEVITARPVACQCREPGNGRSEGQMEAIHWPASDGVRSRESLWSDMPVMRDGRLLDAALRAIDRAASLQEELLASIKSETPEAWLIDAERRAVEIMSCIALIRDGLSRGRP